MNQCDLKPKGKFPFFQPQLLFCFNYIRMIRRNSQENANFNYSNIYKIKLILLGFNYHSLHSHRGSSQHCLTTRLFTLMLFLGVGSLQVLGPDQDTVCQ